MTDLETRYERQSEAPLVPAITRTDERPDRHNEPSDPIRRRVGGLVGHLRPLGRRGGR